MVAICKQNNVELVTKIVSILDYLTNHQADDMKNQKWYDKSVFFLFDSME